MLSDVETAASGLVATPADARAGSDGAEKARLTLRKCDKLKNKADFDVIKQRGKKFSCMYFTMLVLFDPVFAMTPRCGVICSRRFHKRAVVRNRAKRLLFESYRILKGRMRPCGIVLIPRRAIQDAAMTLVKERMESFSSIFKENISEN